MFRAIYNQCRISFRIRPHGPLLIKAGGADADPTRPDHQFVRTHRPDRGPTVYLPGSSLKGVLRSHAERILRSNRVPCCDPLDFKKNCVKTGKIEQGTAGPEAWKRSCFGCRTFGSTGLASRVQVDDAYPGEEAEALPVAETRYGVALERNTQAAARGRLFEQEVIVGGAFDAALGIENFELWQLALLLQSLRDLDDGLLQIGSGKSRGLGTVRVEGLELSYQGPHGTRSLAGIAAIVADGERERYGLDPEPPLEVADGWERAGLFSRLVLRGNDRVFALLDELGPGPWESFVAAKGQRS